MSLDFSTSRKLVVLSFFLLALLKTSLSDMIKVTEDILRDVASQFVLRTIFMDLVNSSFLDSEASKMRI